MDELFVFVNLIQILAPGAHKINCPGREATGRYLLRVFFDARLAAKLKTLKKQRKLSFIVFCKCSQTPNGSKKTNKKPEGRVQHVCTFGVIRWAIHGVWRKRCSPAPLRSPPDLRPGERVGRWIILLGTTSIPPVAQRAGGIHTAL